MDTDSIFISLSDVFEKGDDPELVTEVADEIAAMANESFPDFCQNAFNCPDSRKDTIQTDREMISDSSLFLSKKRYIAHLVNDEGKKCDKLKITGLEIKRSDTPEIVQKQLLELSKMIIDDESMEDILERVGTMRADFEDAPLKSIGKPSGCNGLAAATKQYEETGSLKGIAYQARSALFYNSLCGPEDKKVMPGDKITIVYIKDRRSKYIGFPSDINTLPKFMEDIVIDYDTQWAKAEKKLVDYMKAVGYDLQSRKDALREELFGF